MKKFIVNNSILFTTIAFFLSAKVFIFLAYLFSIQVLPQNLGFVAANRYANFDGVHYMAIAENGYETFQQAFFPLFPILINLVHESTGFSFVDSGLIVTNISFFCFLYFLQKFLVSRYGKGNTAWIIAAFLSLPMAFFLQAVYTESLFLLLLIVALYLFEKKQNFFAFLVCGFLTAVRLNGIFLPIIFLVVLVLKSKKDLVKNLPFYFVYLLIGSFGLLGYMYFLGINYGDPVLFAHVQEAFGANRTTDGLIPLPQVLFRYLKIFLSVSPTTLTFWVSLTEFVIFSVALIMSFFSLKKSRNTELAVFSISSLLLPTLTGTLSSIPRYSLVSLVVPIGFQNIMKKLSIKIAILISSLSIQFFFAAAFFAGHFVS